MKNNEEMVFIQIPNPIQASAGRPVSFPAERVKLR
nr:MAG TPA: hypothetical protein [Caudoviricetes sp.]